MLLRHKFPLRWTKSTGKCATTCSTLYALIRFGTMSRLPQAPVRSPQGTARYQVWEHAFYFITKPSGNIGNHWGNKSGCDALGHRIKPYKNQWETNTFDVPCYKIRNHVPTAPGAGALATGPVSYTHLTLPTNREV